MNIVEATSTCLRKYTTFSGRARRAEYWYFVLATIIVGFVADIIDQHALSSEGTSGPLGLIFSLAIFLPSISAGVRRLHDTNRSGFWHLIVFVPIVGAIAFIVMMVLDGTHGPNRFGEDPKARTPIDPEPVPHSDRIDAP